MTDRFRDGRPDERPVYQRPLALIVALMLLIAVLFLVYRPTWGQPHDASQDARIEECGRNDRGNLEATGVAFNHGTDTKDYAIRVRFEGADMQIAESEALLPALRAGSGRRWSTGTNAPAGTTVRCIIIAIERT